MKKGLFLIAAMACVLVSCTNEGEPSQKQISTQDNAVSFNAYMGETVTKGVVEDNNAITAVNGTGIGVFAFYQPAVSGTRVDFNTRKFATPDFMYNQKVYCPTTAGTWEYTPVKYWPNNSGDQLSFFAYAPYDADMTWDDLNVATDAAASKITASFPIYNEKAAMQDILWTNPQLNKSKASTTTGATDNPIIFAFKHILSKVAIQVGVESDQAAGQAGAWNYDNTDITINSIEFKGLAESYNFSCPITNSAMGTGAWTATGSQDIKLTEDDFQNYVITADNHGTTQTGVWNTTYWESVTNPTYYKTLLAEEGTSPDNEDGFLFFAPQTFTSGAEDLVITYTVLTKVDWSSSTLGANDSKIVNTIECSLADILPSSSFETGKAYTLKFLIGMNSVKVSANVGEWDELAENQIDVPTNKYEAIIGGTKYFSLEDAINAAEADATIELLGNVTVSSAIAVIKNMTLDMQNYTLTNNVPADGCAFTVSEDASFTVTNGTLASGAVDAEISIIQNNTTAPVVYEYLAVFRDAVNAGNYFRNFTVTLLKDITITNDDNWVPIGTTDWNNAFCGIFDGNNHKITLTKTGITGDYGLFILLYGFSQDEPAVVRNLNLDVSLTAADETKTWIGGVTDEAGGYTRFENVTVSGNIVTGRFGGGFTGFYAGGTCVFEDCTNKANITAVIPSGGDYTIIGGISAQATGSSVSYINCRNEGVLAADHTNSPSAPSYIAHMAGKGNYGSSNAFTITGCTYANSATISGWNVTEGDYSTYPFEGSISGTTHKTYFETPNPGKLMIGGYFTSCNLDGTSTTGIYPNGVAHIQMTAAAYLSEDVASRGFYYSESSVYYKSKYDKGKIGEAYSEQFKKDEYTCYVPLTEMADVIGTFGDGFNSSLTWASGSPTAADWTAYKTVLSSYTFTTDASSDACWNTTDSKFVHIYGTKINDSLGKITIKTLPLGGGLGSATNHNIDW